LKTWGPSSRSLSWRCWRPRKDGSVLLSPVCHDWRDGGFNLWITEEDVKAKHLRRDPRATVVVAESQTPYRGVDVRGVVELLDHNVFEVAAAIMARYLGGEGGRLREGLPRDAPHRASGAPGNLRAWDFTDE
jgi:hypothetical protein